MSNLALKLQQALNAKKKQIKRHKDSDDSESESEESDSGSDS